MKTREGYGMETVVALVGAFIGLVIIDSIAAATTFNSTLANTIKDYIVPLGMIGLLGLSGYIAYGVMQK